MIEITNFRQGAVLNHNHGVEDEKSLTIRVEGLSDGGWPVKVNGRPAEMDGRRFSCEVALTQQFNEVTASVTTPYGNFSQDLVLVWDKKSFRRVNYYIDDHSFLFTDLAKERPAHAFDHFYLAGLKKIHDRYGMKVTLNCFFKNDHEGKFTLDQMPDTWKSEFIDNSDWLKFSFHSNSEFPDRPYAEASAEEIGADYERVQNEIVRFAGEPSFTPPIVTHWVNLHPAAAAELIRRGSKLYSNAFRLRVMGGPSLAERTGGGNMDKFSGRRDGGTEALLVSEALGLHYGFQEEDDYMMKHHSYYDPLLGIFFFRGCGCFNLTTLAATRPMIEKAVTESKKYGNEIFGLCSHEQYTFPYYVNYLPDHLQRMEEGFRIIVEEKGCKPVFFNDGLFGNTAWEK